MKGTIKTLNASGHAVLEYDTETGEGVREAEQELATAGINRSAVFDSKTKERIDSPKVGEREDVLVIPPMAGGS